MSEYNRNFIGNRIIPEKILEIMKNINNDTHKKHIIILSGDNKDGYFTAYNLLQDQIDNNTNHDIHFIRLTNSDYYNYASYEFNSAIEGYSSDFAHYWKSDKKVVFLMQEETYRIFSEHKNLRKYKLHYEV